jgi:hypothetical protein
MGECRNTPDGLDVGLVNILSSKQLYSPERIKARPRDGNRTISSIGFSPGNVCRDNNVYFTKRVKACYSTCRTDEPAHRESEQRTVAILRSHIRNILLALEQGIVGPNSTKMRSPHLALAHKGLASTHRQNLVHCCRTVRM